MLTQHFKKEQETNQSELWVWLCKLKSSIGFPFFFFLNIAVSSLLGKCHQIRLWKWRGSDKHPQAHFLSERVFFLRQVAQDWCIHTAHRGHFLAPRNWASRVHSLIFAQAPHLSLASQVRVSVGPDPFPPVLGQAGFTSFYVPKRRKWSKLFPQHCHLPPRFPGALVRDRS